MHITWSCLLAPTTHARSWAQTKKTLFTHQLTPCGVDWRSHNNMTQMSRSVPCVNSGTCVRREVVEQQEEGRRGEAPPLQRNVYNSAEGGAPAAGSHRPKKKKTFLIIFVPGNLGAPSGQAAQDIWRRAPNVLHWVPLSHSCSAYTCKDLGLGAVLIILPAVFMECSSCLVSANTMFPFKNHN